MVKEWPEGLLRIEKAVDGYLIRHWHTDIDSDGEKIEYSLSTYLPKWSLIYTCTPACGFEVDLNEILR